MKTGTEIFLSKLTDGELFFDTKEAVRNEREATSTVVKSLREVNARELYLKYACSSLHQFATEKLGYCGASAQARINAMELVIALPEVEEKIESGELFLTSASKLQTFFRLEKNAKKTYSREEKLEVVDDCLSKSTREVDRELAKRNPEIARFETCKPVGEDRYELKFTISSDLEQKIRKLKGLNAHSQPNMKTEELLGMLVELGLEKFDPVRKAERAMKREHAKHNSFNSLRAHETADAVRDKIRAQDFCDESGVIGVQETEDRHKASGRKQEMNVDSGILFRAQEVIEQPANEPSHRYIPAHIRHSVWRKNADQGCEFVSSDGVRCHSKRALQVDHVRGFARGGSHEVENLRVLCASHNRFVWKQNLRTSH